MATVTKLPDGTVIITYSPTQFALLKLIYTLALRNNLCKFIWQNGGNTTYRTVDDLVLDVREVGTIHLDRK